MNRSLFGRTTARPARRSSARTLQYLLLGLAAAASSAFAIQPDAGISKPVLRRAFLAPELDVHPALEATEQLRETMSRPAAADFLKRNPGTWEMRWDRRGDRPNLVQGSGVPVVPGRGNKLDLGKMGLAAGETIDLAVVEARLLDFVAANRDLLKTDGLEFQLDTTSSVGYGKDNTHWFIEFAQSKNGVRVQGANLFFRVSNGNIVQFGSNLVAPVDVDTFPVSARDKAFEVAYGELGISTPVRGVTLVDRGELLLLPYAADLSGAGEGFRGADGQGYSHRLAWRFVFRVAGDKATYQMMVDAKTNRVIEVRDLTLTVNATVDGGVFTSINTGPETIVPMPFAAVTNGGAKVTDALGIYDYSSGSATVTLDGKYFRMSDACGSISLANSTDGNLHLGTDTGTDCGSTTAPGGAGNTRSSRNGFYYLTKINRKAATFLPSNSWIAGKVTANMNINDVCNAYWDGSTLNFFKSGSSGSTSCSNTGELPAVFLHEWGHGMDTNSGGSASENGTGEAVGDSFAFLETKSACIGNGFFTGPNGCANCASTCTGVRDLNAFSTHGAATIAKPSTITDNAGANCDRFACPYLANGIQPYQGPMGYEGHCESYIASSANWDLAQALVAQYGATAGYAQMDKIWYGSLTPSKSAYRVASGGKCNTAASVDGCGSNNWYTVYLAADDDNGNLADGTPNACRIWDAFNAHGIACGTRPACSGGGTNVPPVANFTFTTSGLTANFTDTSTDSDGTIASRAWNFGDGGTSTAANPSRTYATAGSYTVTLTVTDNAGGTNTKSSQVTVSSGTNVPPTANFTFTTSDLTANFTDSSTDTDGTIASRSWNFGDGGTSTATNPSRTYAAAGTYTVTLTVTDNGGATNTKTSSVTVTAPSGNVLTNGVAVTGLSAAINVDKVYTLVVPAGATNLKFVTTGGSGDADLYVKFGSAPTTTVNDCKSEGSTNAETCNIATAQAGTYYVMVHAYAAYSGLSLTGSFTPPGSGTQTYTNTTDYPINDNATVDSPITVSGRTGNAPTNASVTVAIVHTYIGDLKVDLVAPDGTLYNIHNRTGSGTDNINKTVTLNLSSEALNGTWNLRVNDNASQDTGYINSWSITF
ncbi:PKD domain-containing protein [Tahibacter soli]|uniref:PKD domain-containing protein n=1 Tax=Tahibacter soli TaxID=2983605 RepID=A0A9X3YHM5_9GAMM|nr:PKD domain-containing protein [Tahibacter soli]MDC8012426.1 PKD domain-containing protein [Tahibacter soli]